MKENINDILERAGRNDGIRVPDGYFADFVSDMTSRLPEKEQAPARKSTLWMRVRPYAYMAAMFAGVWCMLRLFTLMSAPIDGGNVFESNPILAEAVSDDAFIDEYVTDDINQWDVIDEMISDGFDTDDFDIAFDADTLVTFSR